MSNWPKNIIIETKARPGTWQSRMHPRSVEWHKFSSKRYSKSGAETALRVLSKRHSGQDMRAREHGTQV